MRVNHRRNDHASDRASSVRKQLAAAAVAADPCDPVVSSVRQLRLERKVRLRFDHGKLIVITYDHVFKGRAQWRPSSKIRGHTYAHTRVISALDDRYRQIYN